MGGYPRVQELAKVWEQVLICESDWLGHSSGKRTTYRARAVQ